jgi:transcriptional regulator with XRE-family HTH domain
MVNRPKWARKLAAQMALDGVQATDIARHYGVTRQYVSNVLNGSAKSETAATAYINDALDAIRAERGRQ